MNDKTILFLGAGYTGKVLAPLALQNGYRFIGTTSNPETRDFLHHLGAESFSWDALEEPHFDQHLGPQTVLIYSIPTLFDGVHIPGPTLQEARHVQPLRRLLDLARHQGLARLIYLSSSSVFGDHQGQWVDEESPLLPTSSLGKIRADIEAFLLQSQTDFPIQIARIVGIYGPGRSLVDRIKRDSFTLVDRGRKVTNRIHVFDLASALLAIASAGPLTHQVFNFTDGHPQTLRDVVEFICTELSLPFPPEESLQEYAARTKNPNSLARWKNTVRVRNQRLRKELGYSFTYPDVFAGTQAILRGTSLPLTTHSLVAR